MKLQATIEWNTETGEFHLVGGDRRVAKRLLEQAVDEMRMRRTPSGRMASNVGRCRARNPARQRSRAAAVVERVMLRKVISGGQQGVDLAALRAARAFGLETGGTAAKG